jgi:hypothetical protein
LAAHRLDAGAIVLVQHAVIKEQKRLGVQHKEEPHLLPQQTRREFLAAQVAVDGVVAETLEMIRQVGQRVIDLAAQQILTVVQFRKTHGALSLPSRLLRKS